MHFTCDFDYQLFDVQSSIKQSDITDKVKGEYKDILHVKDVFNLRRFI